MKELLFVGAFGLPPWFTLAKDRWVGGASTNDFGLFASFTQRASPTQSDVTWRQHRQWNTRDQEDAARRLVLIVACC